jgi:hypothetical protein
MALDTMRVRVHLGSLACSRGGRPAGSSLMRTTCRSVRSCATDLPESHWIVHMLIAWGDRILARHGTGRPSSGHSSHRIAQGSKWMLPVVGSAVGASDPEDDRPTVKPGRSAICRTHEAKAPTLRRSPPWEILRRRQPGGHCRSWARTRNDPSRGGGVASLLGSCG